MNEKSSFLEVEFSVRAANVLHRNGVRTVGDLLGLDSISVRKLKGCGPTTSEEIMSAADKCERAIFFATNWDGGWDSGK